MQKTFKDQLAGLCFIAFGLAFGYASLGYSMGTAFRMGPGYFPLVLSGLLVVLGMVITVGGFTSRADRTPIGRVPVAAIILIAGAVTIFGLTARGLGLAPSLFSATFLSALASRRTSPIYALIMALSLTAFCVLIFVYGLGVPVSLVGPWWSVRSLQWI